jgi:TetR/AcrR family transcriptional regulator, transcriptional repressor for nem operon
VDLVDRYGQDCRRSDEALTAEALRARIDKLLTAQRPLLNAVSSVRDLARWRDEMVRLEQRCDGAVCTFGDLAALLGAGEERERLVVHAGFIAWESLLAAAITRAQDNGDLSPDADPDRLATGLMAALQGGLLLSRTTRDVGQLETALDMALGYVQAHAVTR